MGHFGTPDRCELITVPYSSDSICLYEICVILGFQSILGHVISVRLVITIV